MFVFEKLIRFDICHGQINLNDWHVENQMEVKKINWADMLHVIRLIKQI